MTYIARACNGNGDRVDLSIWSNGRKISRILLPRKPELIRAALRSYPNLKYEPTNSLPKGIKGIDIYA